MFAERADITGYVRIVPNPDGRTCRQIVYMDVNIDAWGVASIVGAIISKGVTGGYAKLPKMVEEWKSKAAGAFIRDTDMGESQWSWETDARSVQEIVRVDDDRRSVHSDEEFFDAGESDSEDSGLTHTDTMSTETMTDTDSHLSVENVLISHQPGMEGMSSAGSRVKIGTEQPPEEPPTWALCGLGGFFSR